MAARDCVTLEMVMSTNWICCAQMLLLMALASAVLAVAGKSVYRVTRSCFVAFPTGFIARGGASVLGESYCHKRVLRTVIEGTDSPPGNC